MIDQAITVPTMLVTLLGSVMLLAVVCLFRRDVLLTGAPAQTGNVEGRRIRRNTT